MKQYVTGFMFSTDLKNVALIHKNRPEWQAGRVNGIGGKVETGEWPIDAMMREFFEETGVTTHDGEWKHKIIMQRASGPNAFTLNVYASISEKIWNVRSITDEKVEIFQLKDALNEPHVPNLIWMLPLVMDNAVEIVRIDYSL